MERQVAFLLACVVACLAGGNVDAYADEHPPIVLVLDPCADVDANEVRRLMPIEAGAPVASADGAAAAHDTTRVSVACVVGSPQLVRLEVRDPASGKTLERVVTLVGVARSDRGRLVAISAVELVAASRSVGREPEPPPVVKPPAPPVVVAVAPPPRPPEAPRWRALAVGGVRGFAGLPRLLPGGGLAVQRAFAGPLSVGGDVMLEGLSQPTALGDVDTLVGSASVAALLRAEAGRVAWETGLGLRGGFARLSGQASDAALGGTMTARWGGPMLALRASLAAGQRFVVSLGGELGYVTAGVAGHVVGANGQASDVAIRGAWWGATLGVGLAR
jgi:hypothetical protein